MNKKEYLDDYCRKNACLHKHGIKCDVCMYEKGREDAIDECIEEVYRIAKSTTDVNKHLVYENVVRKLERLKEQKNER